MRIPRLLFIVLAVALVGGALGLRATTQSPTVSALDTTDGHGRPEPPMLGIHYARGQAGKNAGSTSLLTYHGGMVITTSADVHPIYWGTSWNKADGQDKINGLATFYSGAGSSNYMGTNTEYTSSAGNVSSAVTLGTSATDPSAAPKSAPRTSQVLAEVAKKFPNPTPNAYYPVYSDQPRGHAGYCAWHSWGYINGIQVQFGFFFNLNGDPGCDPQDSSGLHSQGLAALANVSGHELSEMVTDAWGNAWYDASGAENSDKCAWTFNHPLLTFSNGSQWKVQGNWSNAAYTSTTKGCIDGN